MAAMLDALDHAFMQRALIASVLLGMLAGALSPLIVQRRMAFLGSGLAHAAFAGVALGLWLPVDPFWIAAPYTVLVALVIQWLRDRTPLEADTIIGVIFAASMALGIVLLALRRDAMMTDAWSLLFGSILAIRPGDIAVLAVLLAAAVLGRRWWARWAYATFDEDLARVDRPVARRDDYLLVAVLAVVLVAAIKIAGIVLASAFLVLPGAAARLNARTFFGMTVVAIVIGAVTAVAGLLLAYAIDTPSGPTLVLAQTAVVAGAFAVARARQ